MTRRKEKIILMTKYSLKILIVLNDNEIETLSKALSVGQIISLTEEPEPVQKNSK